MGKINYIYSLYQNNSFFVLFTLFKYVTYACSNYHPTSEAS